MTSESDLRVNITPNFSTESAAVELRTIRDLLPATAHVSHHTQMVEQSSRREGSPETDPGSTQDTVYLPRDLDLITTPNPKTIKQDQVYNHGIPYFCSFPMHGIAGPRSSEEGLGGSSRQRAGCTRRSDAQIPRCFREGRGCSSASIWRDCRRDERSSHEGDRCCRGSHHGEHV